MLDTSIANANSSPAPEAQDILAPWPKLARPWRDILKIHPTAEMFPLLSEAELKELSDDIEAHGLQTPVVLFGACDDDPCLIDGRNRLDALQALGLLTVDDRGHLKWAGRRGFDCWHLLQWTGRRGDPYDLVLSFNVHRRHLNAEQKCDLIEKVVKAKPTASNLAVAKQVKADDKTVAKVRRDLEARSEIPNVEVRTDSKGRKQPAIKQRSSASQPSVPVKHKREKYPKSEADLIEMDYEKVGCGVYERHPSSKPALSPKDPPKQSISEKALAEIKYGTRHYLPKMTPTDRQAALDDIAAFIKILARGDLPAARLAGVS